MKHPRTAHADALRALPPPLSPETHALPTPPATPTTPAPEGVPASLAPLHRPMTWTRAGLIMTVGIAATFLALPADAWIITTLGPKGGLTQNLGGDVARELEFLQQFGAVSSMVIAGLVIILQDRKTAPRVWDLAGALAIAGLVANALKMLLGRPRPRIIYPQPPLETLDGRDHPLTFAFFWRDYPLPRLSPEGLPTHLWARSYEVWKGISSDLWSMPSSHTMSAAAAAAVLMRLYPRLTPLLLALMLIVAAARIVFGAHYLSDVTLGMAAGFVIGAACAEGRWVSRWLGGKQAPAQSSAANP